MNETKKDETQIRILIRTSIELCVQLEEIYFLFDNLFQMFQDHSFDEMFLDELKPFIMSGLFSGFDLPEEILLNHIINYYKDSQNPGLIEKIIINLNLKNCPKEVVIDLI